MIKQHMMLALVGTALIAAPALAQSPSGSGSSPPSASQPSASPPSASQPSASANGSQFVTQASAGQWRASKLVGVDIYDSKNEKIGDVNEVLLDKNGKAEAIVLGVGGFLGVGSKDVAISFSAIQWKDMPAPSSSATGSSSTSGAGGMARTNTTTSSSAPSGPKDYPDHGVLNMTKEQLQNAPEFKYASAAASESSRPASTTTPAPAPAPANR